MAKRIYYHVLEHCSMEDIGWQGYYDTEAEAKAEASRLQSYFPDSYFEVWVSYSKREPEIVTI